MRQVLCAHTPHFHSPTCPCHVALHSEFCNLHSFVHPVSFAFSQNMVKSPPAQQCQCLYAPPALGLRPGDSRATDDRRPPRLAKARLAFERLVAWPKGTHGRHHATRHAEERLTSRQDRAADEEMGRRGEQAPKYARLDNRRLSVSPRLPSPRLSVFLPSFHYNGAVKGSP